MRILTAVALTVLMLWALNDRAVASCGSLASETARMTQNIRNAIAASDNNAADDTVRYRNASVFQYHMAKQETCDRVAVRAHAMAAMAQVEQIRAAEDLAGAHAEAVHGDPRCEAFDAVLALYRFATAYQKLYFSFNHGYRGRDFQLGAWLEERMSKDAFMQLPSYTATLPTVMAFERTYSLKRQHAISITPSLCGMAAEVNDTESTDRASGIRLSIFVTGNAL